MTKHHTSFSFEHAAKYLDKSFSASQCNSFYQIFSPCEMGRQGLWHWTWGAGGRDLPSFGCWLYKWVRRTALELITALKFFGHNHGFHESMPCQSRFKSWACKKKLCPRGCCKNGTKAAVQTCLMSFPTISSLQEKLHLAVLDPCL